MRTHTIGAVLRQLKDEFDDVTVSKIRFLESEGLISPDRSDSGYRKFTDGDVDRLRYVLRAQRDRYLPLKVIKEELERIDVGLPVHDRPTAPDRAAVEPRRDGDAPAAAADEPPGSVLEPPLADMRLTLAELAEATGLEAADIAQLRDHGIVAGLAPPGASDDDPDAVAYGADDLAAARLAGTMMELGLEARHLRMYTQFADREVALFQQLIAPLLRQRNPDSRRAANDRGEHLVHHGMRLHRLLLARELRALLRS